MIQYVAKAAQDFDDKNPWLMIFLAFTAFVVALLCGMVMGSRRKRNTSTEKTEKEA
jgi:heme/copper-type cytochrome/quinol oxidase subunit 2